MSALSDLHTVPQEHLDFRETILEIARQRIAPRAVEAVHVLGGYGDVKEYRSSG